MSDERRHAGCKSIFGRREEGSQTDSQALPALLCSPLPGPFRLRPVRRTRAEACQLFLAHAGLSLLSLPQTHSSSPAQRGKAPLANPSHPAALLSAISLSLQYLSLQHHPLPNTLSLPPRRLRLPPQCGPKPGIAHTNPHPNPFQVALSFGARLPHTPGLARVSAWRALQGHAAVLSEKWAGKSALPAQS